MSTVPKVQRSVALGVTVPRGADGRVDRREVARVLAMAFAVAAAIVGAVVVERSAAGLEGWSIVVGIASAIPLYVAGRGWRLPLWLHAAAAAIPVAVLVAGAIDASDGAGFARAARYAYGSILFLGAAAFARTPRRRTVLAAGAALVVLDQFTVGWFPWWGGGDPGQLMVGSFYWHNQFGAFCAAGVALGVFLAAFGRRVVVGLGFVVAAFAGAGALASGSRGALAMVVAAFVAALVVAVVAKRWWAVLRVVAAAAVMIGVAFLLSSTLFFPTGGSPGQAVVARSSDGSFIQDSGATRLEFWYAALRIGADNPLTGVGLSAYGPNSLCYDLTAYASHPHNEWLLAWAETGLLGTVPLLAMLVGAIWLGVRTLRRGRLRGLPDDPGRAGALVAFVALLAHAGMDFDWAWGSLVGMTGLVAGIASSDAIRRRNSRSTMRTVVALVLVAALVTAGVAGRALDPRPGDPLLGNAANFDAATSCR